MKKNVLSDFSEQKNKASIHVLTMAIFWMELSPNYLFFKISVYRTSNFQFNEISCIFSDLFVCFQLMLALNLLQVYIKCRQSILRKLYFILGKKSEALSQCFIGDYHLQNLPVWYNRLVITQQYPHACRLGLRKCSTSG